MRDIYLIDFENVASEGLSGITYLSPEDQVIIFYSTNSNRLSMKMHILIGKSICHLSYFEVSVGGKNALDHQISTWLGYLIGTGAAERSYYIVSRDMGYRHVANFWAVNDGKPRVKCVETIRAAVRLERIRQEKEATNEPVQETEIPMASEAAIKTAASVKVPETPVPVPTPEMLRAVTEPVLELKAAEIPEAPSVEPVAEQKMPAVESTAPIAEENAAEPEPLESLEEPEPGSNRRSYRDRSRFRRNRGKGHTNQSSGNGKHEPEIERTKYEIPAAPVEKPMEQPVMVEKKPEPKPEAPTESKQPEKPAASERYSASFWEKPKEAKPVEQKSEKHQEPKPAAQKPEKLQISKPEKRMEVKPEKPAEPKQESKNAAKSEPRPSEKPEPKEPKTEKKPESQEPKTEKKPEPKQPTRNKPQQRKNGGEKPRKTAAPKQEGHNLEQLPRLIAPYPQLQENTLKELIVANKRQVLCNTLRKQLGQEKGLALYNELKKTVWK